MKHVPSTSAAAAAGFSTAQLRDHYLLSGLFEPGKLNLVWWETDRTIAGGITPVTTPLVLDAPAAMRSTSFFERREGGLLNVGGPGKIRVDGVEFRLEPRDVLYVGRGATGVELESVAPDNPAKFWLLSYPAHTAYPTRLVTFAEAKSDKLGATTSANERTLVKLIHPGAFPTCQLVMGVTTLHPGSIWNTLPPHTHLRRSEVYLYFNLQPAQAIFHFMGEPAETRHLIVRDGEAVLSPPWSIHSGAGTTAYSFVWGMGGENQEFADMDAAPIASLR